MKLDYQEKKQLQTLIKNELLQLNNRILNINSKSKKYLKLIKILQLLIILNKKINNNSIKVDY